MSPGRLHFCTIGIALTSKFAILDLVMQSPLHRLYRTKLVFASFVGVVVGYGLMAVGSRIDVSSGFGFLKAVDLHDIGIVLMTSSLIVVLFTYLANEDAEQDANERTRKALKAEAPAFVEGVVDAMADTPEHILSVTAPDVQDRVIKNVLAARLHDRELATDLYIDLYEQVVRTSERWRDVHVDVTLTPWERSGSGSTEPMFIATIKWEFRTKPSSPSMRLACVSSRDDYQSLGRDPTIAETWQFRPVGGFDAASPEAFDLLQVTVDGAVRPSRRSTRRGAQFFTAELGDVVGKDVAVSYTYRTLVRQNGHLLRIEPARPIKGFSVRLNYEGCGLEFVRTLDYIAGAREARVEELPPTDPAPYVQVSYDGWIFPKSAVAFVWGLDQRSSSTGAALRKAAAQQWRRARA